MPLNVVNKYKWREEDTPIFLEYYKNYECLWNYKLSDYKNRELRYNALTSLLEDLGGEECGLNIEDIKSKIKTIRSKYTSELGKVRRSGNVYVPTVPWYKQADEFLGDVSVPRSTSPYNEMPKKVSSKKYSQKYESEWNSEDEEKKAAETDAAEAGMESECAVTPDSPPIKISHRLSRRRHSRKRSLSSDEVATKRKRGHADTPIVPQDDIATFVAYVGAQLRRFPTRLRCIAKLEINQLLYKLEMEDIEQSPNSFNVKGHETNLSGVSYSVKLQPVLNHDPLTKDDTNEASTDCDD